MTKKLEMIKDIDETRKILKLVVKVIDLWFVDGCDSKWYMEMILIYEKVI